MHRVFLGALLLVVAVAVLGVIGGLVVSVVWRRKFVALLKARHPEILKAAQTSPDVYPFGFPMASDSRLLRAVKDAHVDDAEVVKVARTLRRCNAVALSSMFVLIAFMLGSKLNLW
jgi:hypothetical protein